MHPRTYCMSLLELNSTESERLPVQEYSFTAQRETDRVITLWHSMSAPKGASRCSLEMVAQLEAVGFSQFPSRLSVFK